MNKDKNGLDLILHLDLCIASMESYKLKGLNKKYANMFKKSIEKDVNTNIDKYYKSDEEFVTNALSFKQRMIDQIAEMNEADQILLSEFVNKFNNNIEIARKKGVMFFDKIL